MFRNLGFILVFLLANKFLFANTGGVSPYIQLIFDPFGESRLHSQMQINLRFLSENCEGSVLLGNFWDLGMLSSTIFQETEYIMKWSIMPGSQITLLKNSSNKTYENSAWEMTKSNSVRSLIKNRNNGISYAYRAGKISSYNFDKNNIFRVIYGANMFPLEILALNNEKILEITCCTIKTGELRVKTLKSANQTLEFSYREFEIFDKDGKLRKMFLLSRIKFSDAHNIEISYLGEATSTFMERDFPNDIPKNWLWTKNAELNTMKMTIQRGEKSLEKFYIWDALTGFMVESDNKKYLCAFDSKQKKSAKDTRVKSFQLVELDSNNSPKKMFRWDSPAGNFTYIDYKLKYKEVLNYICMAYYAPNLLRHRTTFINGVKDTEERFIYNDNFAILRKIVNKNGKFEIENFQNN